MSGPARPPRRRVRGTDDEGGVWITTGILLGLLAYGAVLLMLVAGDTAVLPLVVVPPALVVLIGAGNLLGGPRRPAPQPARPLAESPPPADSEPTDGSAPVVPPEGP
ncbi:MAG: hypothetical protein JO368_04745 [Acidimicrobiales bacterium]|nr:hypothetical protein [Acidimicrobiales bacterium]